MSFSDEPHALTELTADRGAATAAIASVEAKGGTALYDAIYTAADRLSREEGRKAIILLSDGRDEAQSGVEPGSLHTLDEALEKALRSEAIVFTIGFGKHLDKEMDFYGKTSLREILDRLAQDSGGTSNYPQRPGQIKGAYDLISDELRNQYSLAYAPRELRADGSWHPIRIEMSDPTLKAFTRRGYYAPKG
jgi:Ca-activated chloride channel family protein